MTKNESFTSQELYDRRRLVAACLISLGAVGCLLASDRLDHSEEELPDMNTIVIIVDDMNDFSCAETKDYLPKSSKWLLDQGRCFEHATTSSPVCCPARAVLQTGQLPHNNRVERQIDARNLDVTETLQYNLGNVGLTTYGVGKFLNGVMAQEYKTGEFDTGFQEEEFWNTYSYLEYPLIDLEGNDYYPEDQEHATIYTGDSLRTYIASAADDHKPFYAYAAFFAPHTQKQTGSEKSRWPVSTESNADRTVPTLKYAPERNVEDKLLPFGELGRNKQYYEGFHEARVRALYDVDDQIAAMFEDLESQGLLDETTVFFMSDNGYLLGENGWEGKAVPYPGSINIPMLAYSPSQFGEGIIDSREVGLVDIAPTIYDMYDIVPGHTMDGHSLLGDYIRQDGQYFEFTNERSKFVLSESGTAPFAVPSWAMYKRGDHAYIEYYDHEGNVLAEEFYDDPGQKRNLLFPAYSKSALDPAVIATFKQALDTYKSCSGTIEANSPTACP